MTWLSLPIFLKFGALKRNGILPRETCLVSAGDIYIPEHVFINYNARYHLGDAVVLLLIGEVGGREVVVGTLRPCVRQ